MYVALDKEGLRVYIEEAEKNEDYFCPVCRGKLRVRKGDIREHHFAHLSGVCEDNWNYDMSEWHMEWKNKDGVTLKALNEDNADKKKQARKSHKTVTTDQKNAHDTEVTEKLTLLHLSSSKVSAKGYYTGGNFVVLKGSQMSQNPRKACRKSLLDRRNMLIENGQVENYVFMENITFGSPSTAAAVILGGETNGWTAWKNDAGATLKEIENKQGEEG